MHTLQFAVSDSLSVSYVRLLKMTSVSICIRKNSRISANIYLWSRICAPLYPSTASVPTSYYSIWRCKGLNTEGRKVFHCVCFVWLLQMPDDVYDTVQCRGWPTGEVTVTCCQWKDCVQYAWVLLSCYNWCNCWGIFSPSFCVFCVCCKPWRMCAMLSKCNKCLWYSVEYVEYSQKTNG